ASWLPVSEHCIDVHPTKISCLEYRRNPRKMQRWARLALTGNKPFIPCLKDRGFLACCPQTESPTAVPAFENVPVSMALSRKRVPPCASLLRGWQKRWPGCRLLSHRLV